MAIKFNPFTGKFDITGGLDPTAVHLAGVEVITGLKTFDNLVRFGSVLEFFDSISETYKIGVSVGGINNLNIGTGFEKLFAVALNLAVIGAGNNYASFDNVNEVLTISGNGSVVVNCTGNGGVALNTNDIFLNATNRSIIYGPTYAALISSSVRFYNGGAGGVDFDQSLLTSLVVNTFPNKNITFSGINNETHTGLTKFSRVAIAEGINGALGRATLVGGAVTIPNVNVTALTEIFVTNNILAGPGSLSRAYSITRVPGVSFTITSSVITDTSTIAYLIIEPS